MYQNRFPSIYSHYCPFIIVGMWTYQLEPNNKYILHSVAQPGWKLIQTLVNEGKMKCDTIWCGTMRKDY